MKIASSWKKALVVLGLLLGWTLAAAAPAQAAEVYRKKMQEFAGRVKKFLDSRDKKDFFLGDVTTMPTARPGPGIKLILKEELENLGVTIAATADFGFTGSIKRVGKDKKTIKLKATIVNRDLDEEDTIDFSFPAPPDVTPLNKTQIVGTRVYDAEKKYGVEILVNEEVLFPRDSEGMPFVKFAKGDIYEIRLINDSDYEALVLLEIDGLNIFAFNEDPEPDGVKRDYRVWVGGKKSKEGNTAVVKGWYRKDGISDSFKVTDYANSVAAKYVKSTGEIGEIGVITATFKAAWDGEEPPESLNEGRSDIGTEKGPPVNSPYASVVRHTGRNRAAVVVRYDKN